MKLVKKILRLLPLLFLLCPVFVFIFNKGIFNGIDPSTDLNDYMPRLYNFLKYVLYREDFTMFINLPIVSGLYNWFTTYIGNSIYFQYAFVVMFYELFLSLIFLMFDCINFVFIWANKFIKKGSDLD